MELDEWWYSADEYRASVRHITCNVPVRYEDQMDYQDHMLRIVSIQGLTCHREPNSSKSKNYFQIVHLQIDEDPFFSAGEIHYRCRWKKPKMADLITNIAHRTRMLCRSLLSKIVPMFIAVRHELDDD
ncbi:hypothetical protein ACTXT7_006814 [Hymenolepis weldensis]